MEGWCFTRFDLLEVKSRGVLPLDKILVHHRLPPAFLLLPPYFAGTHLYFLVNQGTVRLKSNIQSINQSINLIYARIFRVALCPTKQHKELRLKPGS